MMRISGLLAEVRTGDPRPRLQRYLLAILIMLALTAVLWPLRDLVIVSNFSLIYTLAILIIAISLGTGESILAVAISFLIFDYLLLTPRYTFGVDDPSEVVDLIIFILMALIAGQLAAYARKQAASAQRNADEQQILFRLSSSFNQLTERDEIFSTLKQVVETAIPAHGVSVHFDVDTGSLDVDPMSYDYAIQAGSHRYGILRVTFKLPPTESQFRLLQACTSQAATAIQRIDLAERAQRNLAIEEADRLKTALLHAVSHDFRTPISIIKTSANLLETRAHHLTDGDKAEMIHAIGTEVDQLDKLIGNLLDLSRLRAGAMPLRKDWNSLGEVAGDAAVHFYRMHRNERLRLDFPNDLPLIRFDHGLLLQALRNIIENALRFEPESTQVTIRGFSRDDEVGMAIIGHGPRIQDQEKELIMKPFYRIGEKHEQDADRHIGLGLAISKGIVEAHHGRLWVEDTPGTGATFVVTLPREKAELDIDVGSGH